jgi:hypothetical protein
MTTTISRGAVTRSAANENRRAKPPSPCPAGPISPMIGSAGHTYERPTRPDTEIRLAIAGRLVTAKSCTKDA